MKYPITLLAALALIAPATQAGDAPIPPVRVGIVCTVPTPWDPQACWVEFGNPATGPRVEVATQAEGEELIAILLAHGGRRYAFDPAPTAKARPLPAKTKGKLR